MGKDHSKPKKVAPPHLHGNVEADRDVDPPRESGLEQRVEELEKGLAELKQEFADHQRKLHDAGIRLS